jgi:putative DNA primase/helicase
MSSALRYTPLRERARGRWPNILTAIGIDRDYLTRKNGPCPFCGGKDRWRFTDHNQDGCFICSQCTPQGGSGADLVMKFTGLPFKEAAQRIERVIGECRVEPRRRERDEAKTRAGLNSLWGYASSVHRGDPTDLWLRSRSVSLDLYPPTLRTGRSVRHYDDRGAITCHPAMLAIVMAPDSKPSTIHRTYLTADGKKAPVDKHRKLYSSAVKGSAIRLTAPAKTLGISEGIETALAAARLFEVPTWAAICADMLAQFEPPTTVKRLIVFGDHDAHGKGQRAAFALASRLVGRIQVEVKIPEKPDTDWNNALIDSGG